VAATPALLGAPTNSTQFIVWMEGIPTSVNSITWDAVVADSSGTPTCATLVLLTSTFDATAGTALATYSYESVNQTGLSDITVERFVLSPDINLKTGSAALATGDIRAAVSLGPVGGATGCAAPGSATPTYSRPRFLQMWESDAVATNNPPDDPHRVYASIIRCNCYLLFTYVTATSSFNTGIVIANTTGDTAPFGVNEAADQLGRITFYFYDRSAGFVGTTTTAADITSGRSFVDLVSGILPTGVTSFSGYIFAKADFQFCHGFAFIADSGFGNIAHGYIANLVPDPAIKNLGGRRAPADAGDATNIPAGEGLNN
jgi:hypothetical protein